MPEKDDGIDVFEMRSDMDTVQSDTAESVSEVQKSELEYPKNPEDIQYRVRLYDSSPDELLFMDYFAYYGDAMDTFNDVCENKSFIKSYDRMVMADVQRAYRGFGTIFWETITKTILYDDS